MKSKITCEFYWFVGERIKHIGKREGKYGKFGLCPQISQIWLLEIKVSEQLSISAVFMINLLDCYH